jgi:hypothetical protein
LAATANNTAASASFVQVLLDSLCNTGFGLDRRGASFQKCALPERQLLPDARFLSSKLVESASFIGAAVSCLHAEVLDSKKEMVAYPPRFGKVRRFLVSAPLHSTVLDHF